MTIPTSAKEAQRDEDAPDIVEMGATMSILEAMRATSKTEVVEEGEIGEEDVTVTEE
jgi:hypothetical protein